MKKVIVEFDYVGDIRSEVEFDIASAIGTNNVTVKKQKYFAVGKVGEVWVKAEIKTDKSPADCKRLIETLGWPYHVIAKAKKPWWKNA